MDEFLAGAMAGIRLAAFVSLAGASFTLGVAIICRAMKWSPINITVNVDRHGS